MLKVSAVFAAVVTLAFFTGCGKNSGPTQPSQPTYSVTSFVTAASTADISNVQASQQSGAAPSPSGGPVVTPTGNNGAINGGSNLVRLRSSLPFQVVNIYVGGVTGGVNGYWTLRLLSAVTDVTVIVTFGRTMPAGTFDLAFGVTNASGLVGPYAAIQTQVLTAGTGDVQVSASWDALSDVDLHVVEPGGREIYYADSRSPAGGELDLDSNAACGIDRKNNENIRWPVGRAPAGTYIVRLDYWSSCGVAQTNYVVTVNNGGSTSLFRGAFTGLGDAGGRESGRFITSFSRASFNQLDDMLHLQTNPPEGPALILSPMKVRR